MAATKPVCMFCGTRAGPFHDEDVWPKWFRKTVIIDGPIRLQTPAFGRSWRKDGHLRLIIRDAICKRCNNGWMSQIEEEAARPLKRMVSLSVVTLSPEDRDAIALWAVLKACELEVAFSQLGIQPAIIPHGHTQWLYERQSVPPGTTVMLGAVLGALPGDNNATFAWRIAHTIGKESREVGLLSTFTLANVVFQVLAINLR
ncbi:MAG: hypothetical protein ACXVK4_05465, partial [Acidimicrobiia bacterium]